MNLVEKISPNVSCPKLMILVKDHKHSNIYIIRAQDYNYYCAKYGYENIELIAREGVDFLNETNRDTAI